MTKAKSSVPTVLMVANYAPDVGFAWWLMESFWVGLAQVASRQGIRALLAYPEEGTIPQSIQSAAIDTVTLDFPGRTLSDLVRAIALVRHRNVAAVYFTDRSFTSVWYAALRLAGARVIVTHDHTPGDRPTVGGIRGALKALWRRLPLIEADLQLCVSPPIQQRAVSNARIPRARNAVAQNSIKPIVCTGDRDSVRREFLLPADAVVCVTVSRAHLYKRIDFVVAVAREVVQQRGRSDVYFVFCGDGPDMERLKELALAAELGAHFVFAGRRSDVHTLLCSADLAIHPSQGEAFSLAVLEYMSVGLALLAPDIPTVCQAIDHDRTGLAFRDGDVEAAAELVCQLANDPTRRSILGQAAEAKVLAKVSSVLMHQHFQARMTLVPPAEAVVP